MTRAMSVPVVTIPPMPKLRWCVVLTLAAVVSACRDSSPVPVGTAPSVQETPAPPPVPAVETPPSGTGAPANFAARVDTPADAKPGDQVNVKEFHPNGVMSTERTEIVTAENKRVRVGPMRAWWENGALRIEGGYDQEGKLSGRWKYYDQQGQLQREGDYDLGMRSGDWVEFHPNGKERSRGFVHANLNEGQWVYWHDNGQKMAEGSYLSNQREGVWLFWDEKGQPDKQYTGTYKQGVKIE